MDLRHIKIPRIMYHVDAIRVKAYKEEEDHREVEWFAEIPTRDINAAVNEAMNKLPDYPFWLEVEADILGNVCAFRDWVLDPGKGKNKADCVRDHMEFLVVSIEGRESRKVKDNLQPLVT